MTETIEVKIDEQIAEVLLNRPAVFNAFDLDMIGSFTDNLISLATDSMVQGVVISGKGKAFCAGGDLKWAHGFQRPFTDWPDVSTKQSQRFVV